MDSWKKATSKSTFLVKYFNVSIHERIFYVHEYSSSILDDKNNNHNIKICVLTRRSPKLWNVAIFFRHLATVSQQNPLIFCRSITRATQGDLRGNNLCQYGTGSSGPTRRLLECWFLSVSFESDPGKKNLCKNHQKFVLKRKIMLGYTKNCRKHTDTGNSFWY